MNYRRFFSERDNLRVGSSVKLPEREANHIRKSLRLQKRDKVIIFNGEREFIAELRMVTKDAVMARLTEEITEFSPQVSNLPSVCLYQSLIQQKNFELIIQKATELGISRIVPVNAEYTQVKLPHDSKKKERWEKIIIDACKQSERASIPSISEPLDIQKVDLNHTDSRTISIALTLPRQSDYEVLSFHELSDDLKNSSAINIIVGPEGGFSDTEHAWFNDHGVKFVSLGEDLILRSETAAITGLAIVSHILNA